MDTTNWPNPFLDFHLPCEEARNPYIQNPISFLELHWIETTREIVGEKARTKRQNYQLVYDDTDIQNKWFNAVSNAQKCAEHPIQRLFYESLLPEFPNWRNNI